MVGVAQLVEHPVVVRDVAGSSPVAHPTLLILTYLFIPHLKGSFKLKIL